MEVKNIHIVHHPESGTHRLQADVLFSDGRGGRETIWLEVDEAHGEALSTRADPWICYMLPLAALHRDPVIRVAGTASRRFVENVPRLVSTWHSWYPKLLSEITVECDEVRDEPEQHGTEAGLFFSGGVDSWFSLLYEDEQGEGVDALVAVLGWDVPLDKADAVEKMSEAHERVAKAVRKGLFIVRTNMRAARFGESRWGPLTHGAALAMVAHALAPRFRRMLIASTHSLDMLIPWGSHPDTDHMFSTEATDIVHHGAEYNRVEKTKLIAKHQVALDHLHVCWRNSDETNCSRCEKCLRTMAALELLGVLDRSKSFVIHKVQPDAFRQVKAYSENVRCFLIEVRDFAREVGRNDIVDAIEQCLRRGRLYRVMRNLVPDVVGGPRRALGKPLRAIWKRI